jgi:hypothetical protein
MTAISNSNKPPILRWAFDQETVPTTEEIEKWPHVYIKADDIGDYLIDDEQQQAIFSHLQNICGGWDWYTRWVIPDDVLLIGFSTDADAVAFKLTIGDVIADSYK